MKPVFAAIQLCSRDDLQANLARVAHWLEQAALAGAQLVVLPENFAVFAPDVQRQTAARLPWISEWLAAQARRWRLWLVAGSIPCATRPDGTPVSDGRVRATCLVFDDQGELRARYDKVHLFDVQVADVQASYQESATFEPGDQAIVVPTPWGGLGLSICYDIRFPLLFQELRERGADFVVVPAAFTALTGAAHWQVLLRARAIETQCCLIGSGQGGQHNSKRHTWGHSQIVDAWGNVLAELPHQEEGVVVAACDLDEQAAIRERMPIFTHRRLF